MATPNDSQRKLVIQIADHEQLKSASSLAINITTTSTVKEVLHAIAKKNSVFDTSLHQEDKIVESYALYLQGKTAKSKYKIILDDTLVKDFKKTDTILFKKRDTVKVYVYLHNLKHLNRDKATAITAYSTSTIQDLVNKAANNQAFQLNPANCALFLPTTKSKKGIYMEPHKRIIDLRLANEVLFILKYRQPEEIILAVDIEDYIELKCAKTITSLFNINCTVQEILSKIARRGNVFIEDISKFKLVKPPNQKLEREILLKHYDLQNHSRLILRKKSALFAPKIPEDSKAVLLGERTEDKAQSSPIFKFYSEEREELFWSLSMDSFTEEFKDANETMNEVVSDEDDISPLMENPISATVAKEVQVKAHPIPEPKSEPEPKLPKKPSDRQLKHEKKENGTAETQAATPKKGSRKRGPLNPNRKGALVSKKNQELALVCIYYADNKFWALAVSSKCTVEDVCKSISELTRKNISQISIFEGIRKDGGNFLNRKIDYDEVVNDIKNKWGENSTNKFVAIIESSSKLKDSDGRDSLENFNKVIPNQLRTSKDLETMQDQSKTQESGKTQAPFGTTRRSKQMGQSPNAIFVGTEMNKREFKWIEPSELKKTQKINKGAFAKVYKGLLGDKVVAIKTMIGSVTEDVIHSFRSECEVLSAVPPSPHLVTFFGACIEIEGDKLSLIMEYCPNGSLYSLLHDEAYNLTWKKAFKWIVQTIEGVNVLHTQNPPLVHRDIKTLNLLLDENWDIKVCDFGLSRFRTMTNVDTLGEIRGTMAYCPPEIYDAHIFSSQSDIYSIGIVIWEIMWRLITKHYERPFSTTHFPDITFDFQIIIKSSKEEQRPPIPEGCPPVITELIQNCWQKDPEKRPNCTALLTALKQMQMKVDGAPEDDCGKVLLN